MYAHTQKRTHTFPVMTDFFLPDVGISFVRAVDRFVVGSWMLVAMVIIWAYGCNLVSLLAARNIPQSIQNLQDLVDTDIQVLLRPNTALSAYLV